MDAFFLEETQNEAKKADMKLRKIDDYRWEIPKEYKDCMRVPGVIYADERLLEDITKDNSLEQVANGASFPGIVKASLAMPDIHYGYGLPIGGVVATDLNEGVISPGATGYDINCGVRVLRSSLNEEDIRGKIEDLVNSLFGKIPSGVGSKGMIKLTKSEQRKVSLQGARWAVENGYGEQEDLEFCESNGAIQGAVHEKVSEKASMRGRAQLGTLGSGNHFVEVQYIQEVYDRSAADAMGLWEGQVAVMIHSGSRGFGHQICTDYLQVMNRAVQKYSIELPDRQLACAPYNSPEGKDYLGAMRSAANFAWANRQCLTYWTREAFQEVLGMSPKTLGLTLIYDVAHNIIKIEEHEVDGRKLPLAVHRKGATRAFPPHHPEIPEAYRSVGQPVIIPGDMGRASYILAGTERAMEQTFGSTCHGAGRLMSRKGAIRAAKGRSITKELEAKNILVRGATRATIEEEMPEAYKDVSDVVRVVHNAGISRKVAKMVPMCVIKG
jgi:tRNA-splicing ligase RtcB